MRPPGLSNYLSGVMITAGVRGLALIVSFGLSVMIARKFGAVGAGEYYSIMGTSSIVAAVIMRGADQLLVREVGNWSVSHPRDGSLRQLTLSVLGAVFKLFRSPVIAFPVLMLLTIYALLASIPYALGLLAGSVVLLASQFACSLAQGLGRPSAALFLQTAVLPAITIALLWVFLSIPILGLLVLSAVLTTSIAIGYMLRVISQEERRNAYNDRRLDDLTGADVIQKSLSINKSFFWLTIGNQIIVWSPVFVLYFFGDPASAGVFSTAIKLASTLSLGIIVSNAVITKPLAAAIAVNNVATINRVILEATAIGIAIGAVPMAMLLLLSDHLTTVFGAGFASARAIMNILLVGQTVMFVVGPSALVLVMCKQEQLIARASVVIAATLLVLLPLAIRYCGEIVFAWIYTAAICINGLLLLQSSRHTIGLIGEG